VYDEIVNQVKPVTDLSSASPEGGIQRPATEKISTKS